MESVFLLVPEARGRFLRGAASAIGCSYICLWSYLPHPSNCLASLDGCYHEDDGGGGGEVRGSSSSGSFSRRLFDAYRNSICSVHGRHIYNRCVPGLAYREGLPYVEISGPDLINSAFTQVQQDFYQEAGIKTAVFMGCRSGEIELGLSTLSNANIKLSIQQLFAEDPPRQLTQSSSSSSLRSLSVGSPEYSSLLLINRPSTSFALEAPKESTIDRAPTQPVPNLVPRRQITINPAFTRPQPLQFPDPSYEDDAITNAMLAVIASTSSAPPPPLPPLLMSKGANYQTKMGEPVSPFKPYRSTLGPNLEPVKRIRSNKQTMIKGGQAMIKGGISILRLMRIGAIGSRDARPTSNQLHHMISERKRREKLNESFHALRMLLPSGAKRDKASVLAKTKDYVNTLKSQIFELEERNRMLEMQLPNTDEANRFEDSGERIDVRIASVLEPTTPELRRVVLRVRAPVECDVIDLVLRLLECLKGMKGVALKSVDADAAASSGQANALARATLTIQMKGVDWDEESFTEAVKKAVAAVAAASPVASDRGALTRGGGPSILTP